MMLYVNGQDIARLVMGTIEVSNGEQYRWSYGPETIACGPEGFLAALDAVLGAQQIDRSQLTGFALVSGPGSPTALRASHAMVNALAFTLDVPIATIEKGLQMADVDVLEAIKIVSPAPFAFPKYGSAPTITTTTRDALKRAL